MSNFSIRYQITAPKSFQEQIALLPEVKEPSILTATSAHISIYMDGKLLTSEKVVNRDFTFNVWLLYFCPDLANEVSKIIDGKEHRVFVVIDSGFISFQKEKDKVKVKFVGTPTAEAIVKYSEFLQEIFNILNSFLEESLVVNRRVIEVKEYQKILEGRDKIKQMLEESKTVPGLKDVRK